MLCFCLFQGFTSEQMRLAEENSALIEQREKEIQSIVQSISELNEIFRDLATMIVEQVSFLCLTLMYKIYCHLLMFLAVTMLSEVCSSFWKVWIIKNVHKTTINFVREARGTTLWGSTLLVIILPKSCLVWHYHLKDRSLPFISFILTFFMSRLWSWPFSLSSLFLLNPFLPKRFPTDE